jgi:hypothetical protein
MAGSVDQQDRICDDLHEMRPFVLLALCTVAAVFAFPVYASPPDVNVFKVDDTFTVPAGDFCSFPIVVHSTGKFRVAVYFNKDGSVRQVSQNPSLVDVLTNPLSGSTITSADRGLDKLVFNSDGTVFQLSTGVHLKVKGVYYEIGLRKILFSGDPDDPSSSVLSFEQHGNFGDDASAAICPLLA